MSDDEESPPQAQPVEGLFLFTRLVKKPRISAEAQLEDMEAKIHQDSLPIFLGMAGHIPRNETCELTLARKYDFS